MNYTKPIKAPVGRMGGKSKLAKRLIKMFPKEYNTYVEPFLGSGNVYFRIPYKVTTEVINDFDEDIYIIMKALKTDAKYINENINRDIISKQYFMDNRTNKEPIKVLECLKSAFLSDRKRGYSVIRGSGIKTNFTPYGERLQDTLIFNKSFEFIINEYDSNQTFFYLDPPYESKTKKDYKDYVTPQQVYDAIKNIKGKFMISYNDSENIRTLFKDFFIMNIQTQYTNTQYVKPRQVNEIVITNY